MTASLAELVARMGPHPAARAGLDLSGDAGAARWLALALLLSTGADEERALAAARALPVDLFEAPARTDVAALAVLLMRERVPRPERVAAMLARTFGAYALRWDASLARLAADADDLETLGARLAALAPGVGRATVLRFLRPLREQIRAAREVPLAAASRAAAVHLSLLSEGDDEEGEPVALRGRIAREPDAPAFADVEAALERLGAEACLRDRVSCCPLGEECPRRSRANS